jgi:hypothetical protein
VHKHVGVSGAVCGGGGNGTHLQSVVGVAHRDGRGRGRQAGQTHVRQRGVGTSDAHGRLGPHIRRAARGHAQAAHVRHAVTRHLAHGAQRHATPQCGRRREARRGERRGSEGEAKGEQRGAKGEQRGEGACAPAQLQSHHTRQDEGGRVVGTGRREGKPRPAEGLHAHRRNFTQYTPTHKDPNREPTHTGAHDNDASRTRVVWRWRACTNVPGRRAGTGCWSVTPPRCGRSAWRSHTAERPVTQTHTRAHTRLHTTSRAGTRGARGGV